jgi:hypothetical protein
MSRPGNSFNIPHYLKAVTPEGLRLAMLKLNMMKGKEHDYYQIVFDGSSWFAWYYDEAKEQRILPIKR